MGAIAAEIRERLDVREFAPMAGFRVARGRRDRFHCIHGKDLNPSARVYRRRVVCDSCEGRWSSIDLLQIAHGGIPFIEAVRLGADLLGIPWGNLSSGDRERLQRVHNETEDLSRNIEDWIHGLQLWAEARKNALIDTRRFAWKTGADSVAEYVEQELLKIPRAALDPLSKEPSLIARAYVAAAESNPGATARITAAGREDREHAAIVTRAIIEVLAASTAMPEGAHI